jgi:hypothetical protein
MSNVNSLTSASTKGNFLNPETAEKLAMKKKCVILNPLSFLPSSDDTLAGAIFTADLELHKKKWLLDPIKTGFQFGIQV